MSCPNLPPYILQELPDITETIKFPIKNVQRIKYTCFDISRSLIAFGATSGGIYVFNRWPCEFVQLIPNKDGPITRLAISIDEKHIGFANGKGVVTVTGCDQLQSGYSSTSSKDHSGNEVTALIWSRNMLFSGDDIGKISVLQLQSFIAKTMFQSSSQIIMSLDSRICQLDCRESMLLVSTLTRCYICNIVQEQYRQIGQKLRDGEFGVCFASKEQDVTNGVKNDTKIELTEVKKYDKVEDDCGFPVGEEFNNTVIFCSRPSSRLWEATVDGMVRRTHQFKQVLSKNAMNIISAESYSNENVCLEKSSETSEAQSVNFTKIFSINDVIFAFNKSALYFLNVNDVDDTVWYNQYKDIVESKIYRDVIYIWLSNGTLVNLRFLSLDKFLIKCFLDEKFTLCAELCALYKDFLMSRQLSPKLHILSGLREKLKNNETKQSLDCIFDKFDSLKSNDVAQLKSGIYVVENSYNNHLLLDDDIEMKSTGDNVFSIAPDTLQALKGLQVTVSDKLNSGKQRLKEKWEDFEEKMKHMSTDKNETLQVNTQDTDVTPKWISRDEYVNEDVPQSIDNDIIYKESSQDTIEVDNNIDLENDICKKLYQYSRLSLVNKEADVSNLASIIESHDCDINRIYDLMLSLENYCVSIGVLDESKFVPNNIFLTYLNSCAHKSNYLDIIIRDEKLYKYFVDSCIAVNIKNQMLMNIGCECGFPLPYVRTSQMPVFSELIDEFIEIQWSSQTKEQCYEVCKRMPHLWKKILYLRRNEDLINVLRVLLQMLDENLLHSFLPQFTIDTWERAIQLYATLYANICLNCGKKFDHISVKDTLSWDLLGSLIIKSVGGTKAIEVMKKHSHLIEKGALTIKFYHSCILVSLFEKFDGIIAVPLVNCLYSSYDYEESRNEMCKLLNGIVDGNIKNTALPLTVAATSAYWGLKEVYETFTYFREADSQNTILHDILLAMTTLNTVPDCSLCGLPLHNEVLIQDGGLWVFKCGHTFHGTCLDLNKIKLCPTCPL